MAAESSDGLGGRPGERWRNMTGDIWYQLASSLRSCAVFSFQQIPECSVSFTDTENRTLRARSELRRCRSAGHDAFGCPAGRGAQLADPVGGPGVVVGSLRRGRGSPRLRGGGAPQGAHARAAPPGGYRRGRGPASGRAAGLSRIVARRPRQPAASVKHPAGAGVAGAVHRAGRGPGLGSSPAISMREPLGASTRRMRPRRGRPYRGG